MYAEERQALIAAQARSNGRVEVASLAAHFDVATETIRRDLSALERHGSMRRVHGGAIPVERLGFEPGLAARAGVLTAEKERIAKAALSELPEEGAILLDAGTTTGALAAQLPADLELTVVTNGLPIAQALAGYRHLTVLHLGGRVRGRTMATVDAWALAALRGTYVDVAFLGTNGISPERGLTTADTSEAAVKHAMISSARRCVVLADHTKVGNDGFARFGTMEDVDVLFTDSGLDQDLAADLENAGPRVVRA
jgi:DeoR family fructose operon transcriptional repressor